MKKWRVWLGILISAIFLYLALRGLDLAAFWEALQGANYWWLIPGVGVYFIGVWVRTRLAWALHVTPAKRHPNQDRVSNCYDWLYGK